jgi:hypothetical protein
MNTQQHLTRPGANVSTGLARHFKSSVSVTLWLALIGVVGSIGVKAAQALESPLIGIVLASICFIVAASIYCAVDDTAGHSTSHR